MLKHSARLLAAAAIAMGAGTSLAHADACSGRNHTAGTVAGAIIGGIIGNQFGHGGGKAAATAGGVILGGMAGNAIARDMDCDDQPYAERSFHDSFYGRVGVRNNWRHGDNYGYTRTSREYWRHGRLCRDFTSVNYRHGRRFVQDGTACRQRDGTWEFL